MQYVECTSCKWQLENYPDRNWQETPCRQCQNTRKVQDPKTILCNMCGECMCPIGAMNEQHPHGLYKASVMGGYDSYHLFDCNQYTFSFCEKCLRQMFIACKIKPLIEDINLRTGEPDYCPTWESEIESYDYRLWYDNGGFHQAYLDKKCNKVKDCPNRAVYTVLLSDRDFSEECVCEEHKSLWERTINARFVPFISNILKPFL